MKKHKLFPVVLSVVLLFNVIAIPQTVFALDSTLSASWQDKIDDEVYESPIYENGKRLVYIARANIPKEIVSKHLLKNYRYDSAVYENEARYESEIVPVITTRVVAELGKTAAYSTQEQFELTGERISAVDMALSDDYNEYIMAKRAATKDLYVASNTEFFEDNIDNEDDIVYQGKFTSSFILYATDKEIEKYAKCDDVELISPFYDDEFEDESVPTEQIQIGVDSLTGTKSSQYNSGIGYKGTGVKIGIIEANSGKFSSTAPQLSSIPNTQLVYLNPFNVTENNTGSETMHATMVTSLIVGQSYLYDGCIYEGIVPNATVYQIAVPSPSKLNDAFTILAELGVSVINMSAGVSKGDSYYEGYDGEFDRLIENTGITFVKSAGNNSGSITSPGKAYNAITVGNLWTKNNLNNGIWEYIDENYQSNYRIYTDSSYTENSFLANKPDVVAPGTGIEFFFEPNAEPEIFWGTSFSAPLVTGIVAQLHQLRPSLRGDNATTKAIILAGATHENVCTETQYIDSPYIGTFVQYENLQKENVHIRDKTGAGLVNAANSIDIALNYQCLPGEFNFANYTTIPIQQEFYDFYVPAGKKARVVLTFNRNIASNENMEYETGTFDGNTNNVDFYVYNYNTDELIASSQCVYNNTEIVEFSVSERTRVYVDVIAPNVDSSNIDNNLMFGLAVLIE